MKIAINMVGVVPEIAGGAGAYARDLVKTLDQFDSENEYFVLLDDQKLRSYLTFGPGSRVKTVYIPWQQLYIKGIAWLFIFRPKSFFRLLGWLGFKEPGLLWKIFLNLIGQALFRRRYFDVDLREIVLTMQSILSTEDTAALLRRIIDIDRLGIDLIHFPISIIPPLFSGLKMPFTVTIHDIQQEFHPEFFDAQETRFRKRTYKSSADRADAIIADSEFTRTSLVEKYGILPEKIVASYMGCSELFSQSIVPDRARSVKDKYRLPSGFLLYPASLWPHKNHTQLLKAMALLRRNASFNGSLILTGNPLNRRDEIRSLINELGLSEAVLFLEYIPLADMPVIYSLATLLVFPSLFEGFGIPILEAMSVGLPVACSKRASIPEVAGDAALYFNPEDTEDMAKKIWALWEDKNLRAELVQKGRERAGMFSWKRTAEITLGAYRRAYQSYQYRAGTKGNQVETS